jgi:hypothetical protein
MLILKELVWWPGTESNHRRQLFQGLLPSWPSDLESADRIDSKKLVSEVIQDDLGSVRLISARRCSVIVRALSGTRRREPYSESVLGSHILPRAVTDDTAHRRCGCVLDTSDRHSFRIVAGDPAVRVIVCCQDVSRDRNMWAHGV